MKKLLYPTALSDDLESALSRVIHMAFNLGAELHAVHVIEKTRLHLIGLNKSTVLSDSRRYEEEKIIAAQRLAIICERCSEGNISCVSHVAIGDPATEILNYIEQNKIDVVLLALKRDRGYNKFDKLSSKIVRKSNAMVITFPVR